MEAAEIRQWAAALSPADIARMELARIEQRIHEAEKGRGEGKPFFYRGDVLADLRYLLAAVAN